MASVKKCLKAAVGISDHDLQEFDAYLNEVGATPISAIDELIDDVTQERAALVAKIEVSGGKVVTEPAIKNKDPEPVQATEKLQDFGEVLDGAKKHTYILSKAVDADIDVAAVPLSKSFPQPNYEQLIADGLDPRMAVIIAQTRGEIKSKPRNPRQAKTWAESVNVIRKSVGRMLSGDMYFDLFVSSVDMKYDKKESEYMTQLRDIAELGTKVLPSQIKDLAAYKLSKTHFTIFKGETNVSKWTVTNTAKDSGWGGMANQQHFDTKQEALDHIRESATSVNEVTGKAQTKFDIWSERGKDGVFLGKKIASRKYIELKRFDTTAEARAYRDSHNDELTTLLAEKKKVRAFRRIDNNPRIGDDYRNGDDVTPELFSETYGFRGVQFGNWVEGIKRQADLNNAYDGLMDLANLLGIPPQAMSLNGSLGLAFGARGSGGKNPAAAHYEPDSVNINLTKKEGAGSLAHEWFHALDNYFGKMDGAEKYMTEHSRPKRKSDMKDGRPVYRETTAEDFDVREEVYEAWQALAKAISSETALVKRSSELDNARSKDYWSTVREMTARSFERYVIDRLAESDSQSDYLANIVSEEAHDADNALFNSNQPYPYPLQAEMEVVNKAYDGLFNILESKDTDNGVALYSKDSAASGVTVKQATATLSKSKRLAKAIDSGLLKVVQSEIDIPVGAELYSVQGAIQGAYLNGVAYVVADGNTQATLESTAIHELTHAMMGSGDFMRDTQREEMLGRLQKARNISKNNPFWKDVDKRVKDANTPQAQALDETAGYAVTEYLSGNENLPTGLVKWVKEFTAQLKAAWFKYTGKQFGEITPQELIAMTNAFVDFATGNRREVSGSDIALASKQGYEGKDIGEAKEWLAAKAKGLDMSKAARMKRAKAMGFDVDTTYYHGTGWDVESFTNNVAWFTEDSKFASEYAELRDDQRGGGGNVMPALLIKGNTFNADTLTNGDSTISSFVSEMGKQAKSNGIGFDNERVKDLLSILRSAGREEESGPSYAPYQFWMSPRESFGGRGTEAITELYKLFGIDSISYTEDGVSTIGIVDKTQIRSVNAAFDPGFADSHNLLASKAETIIRQWQKKLALLRKPGSPKIFRAYVDAPLVAKHFNLLKEISISKQRYNAITDKHPDLPANIMEGLPLFLSDPLVIYSRKNKEATFYVEAETEKGEPIIIGVEDGRITTVTPKHDTDIDGKDRLAREIGSSKVIYARDKKALDESKASSRRGRDTISLMQNNKRDANGQDLNKTILFKDDIVKIYKLDEGQPLFSLAPADTISKAIANSDLDTKSRVGAGPAAMTTMNVQSIVSGIAAKWKGAPNIIIADSFDDLPASLQKDAEKQGAGKDNGGIDGAVHKGDLYIVAGNVTSKEHLETILFHEALGHKGLRGLYGKDLGAALNAIIMGLGGMRGVNAFALKNNIDITSYAKGLNAELIGKENKDKVIMEEVLAFLVEKRATETVSEKVVRKVKEVMGLIRQWLRDSGLVTLAKLSDSDILHIVKQASDTIVNGGGKTSSGDTALRVGAIDSIKGINKTIADSDLASNVKEPFQKAWQAVKSQAMGGLTLRQLGEVTSRILPIINERYLPLKDAMVVEINEWMNRGATITNARAKLSESENIALSEVQQEATIAGVDPAKRYKKRISQTVYEERVAAIRESNKGSDGGMSSKSVAKIEELDAIMADEPARQEAYERLSPMYQALSDKAKAIYDSELNFHKDLNTKRLEVIEKRITDTVMSPASKAALLDKLKEKFEAAQVQQPYFPLSRFGEFWVHSSQDGQSSFDMFETAKQRDTFQAKIEKEGAEILGSGKNLKNMQNLDGVSSSFIADVDKLIGGLGDDPMVDELRKNVYDLYLATLPDMNVRKHFIRRKNTRGFNKDQSRAFADSVQHGSKQLGKLMYSEQLGKVVNNAEEILKVASSKFEARSNQERIDQLNDYLEQAAALTVKELEAKVRKAKGNDKALTEMYQGFIAIKKTMSNDNVEGEIERLGMVKEKALSLAKSGSKEMASYAVEELRAAHTAIMNPNTHPLAQVINSVGFVWFLGLTPAAALVNITQTVIIGLPLIGSKYGFNVAAKHLKQATKDFFHKGADGKFSIDAANITENERSALDEWYATGMLDNTLSHDTAGIAENGINNGSRRHKAMAAASYMFHRAEQFNREVTAIAAYRSAIESGESHQVAVKAAGKIVWDTHFDYTAANRARFLRGNVMRVVAQFKQYSQSIIYLYGRLFHEAFMAQNPNKEEITQARKALAGILSLQVTFAGAAGLPLSGVVMGISQLMADLFGDDDEPFLVAAELRQAVAAGMVSVFGNKVGKFVSDAATNGLVNAATPVNLSGRISHDGLVFRGSDAELTGRNASYDSLKSVIGVPAAYFEMPFVAAEHWVNGNQMKAVETIMPKFMKDILKSVRYGTEDAKTSSGYVIKDMNAGEVLMQLGGFSSSSLSEQYGMNNARNNYDNRLKSRRSRLINNMVNQKANEGDIQSAQADIDEWNKKHPNNLITAINIKQSEKGKQRHSDGMVDGRFTTGRYLPTTEKFSWSS